MTDETALDPTVPVRRRRLLWPFLVGGGILLVILIVAGIIVARVAIPDASPKQTVLDYDRAYAAADCDRYQSTLTEGYREKSLGEDFDCGSWVENAKTFTVDGSYLFTVDVVSSKVDGDSAQVVTSETDSSKGGPYQYTVRYYLVKDAGVWLIDDIVDETPK